MKEITRIKVGRQKTEDKQKSQFENVQIGIFFIREYILQIKKEYDMKFVIRNS